MVPSFVVGFVEFNSIFEKLFAALLTAFLHVGAGLHFDGRARFDLSVEFGLVLVVKEVKLLLLQQTGKLL